MAVWCDGVVHTLATSVCGHDGQRKSVAHMPTAAKATADSSSRCMMSGYRKGRVSNQETGSGGPTEGADIDIRRCGPQADIRRRRRTRGYAPAEFHSGSFGYTSEDRDAASATRT